MSLANVRGLVLANRSTPQLMMAHLKLVSPQYRHLGTSMPESMAVSSPSSVAPPPHTDHLHLSSHDYKSILEAENQHRCMDKMRNLPAFPRPKTLTPNKHEKNVSSVLIALCQERES